MLREASVPSVGGSLKFAKDDCRNNQIWHMQQALKAATNAMKC